MGPIKGLQSDDYLAKECHNDTDNQLNLQESDAGMLFTIIDTKQSPRRKSGFVKIIQFKLKLNLCLWLSLMADWWCKQTYSEVVESISRDF